ncbi:MAG: DUF1549 and DUF1553 domain-containing protein, partial [Gemmataceae bacterium]|nr:DUF1549 and DUF1553 domain-containing protein [Gemmataceae bacterium]
MPASHREVAPVPACRAALVVLLLAAVPAVRADETWWSYRPVTRPVVPAGRANPIDAFVAAKLGEKGLSQAPEADRRTLIRRLTFDLTGLPPTPEEVAAFLADTSPDSYEKLVDRLLASPHYGERMARQWMDVVHFAETHGHDQDRVRPNAWRYRDYLIRSFNADTPYDRFVREQLAADVLYPDRPELTPALGFLAAGPWDESSLRDIRDDSIDRQVGYYLDRDDVVTTVMSTFQGLTVQCARCHDHKFDPISQLDYYRLQAVFAGVGRGDVSYDPDAATAAKRKDLKAKLAALDRNAVEEVVALDSADLHKAVAEWEARHRDAGVVWKPLGVTAVKSEHGATLTKLPDGSIRSEGLRPERDTYTVTARVKLKGVTAVRLELLTDDALPHHGPGRQDNGNLHLSEVGITAAGKSVPLRGATADFDQTGWTVSHAIDGNAKTAWGIYPEVGKPHEAVFEFKEPAGDGDTEFTVRLDQLHGGGHLIGRFRLSVTVAAPPVKAAAVPSAVRAALAVPAEKRTPTQARELAAFVTRERLTAELAALPAPLTVYAAAPNFNPDGSHKPVTTPRAVHLLKRGDIRKPGEVATPGTLACLPGLPAEFELPANHPEGARRAALAKWLTDPKNPLTWRVIVNRVWQAHFGRGLVASPNDFGKMGQPPSHPELLDWLAAQFRDGGMSLKKLHRLIATSGTYRQSSSAERGIRNAEGKTGTLGLPIPHSEFRVPQSIDADNRLLWRMPRTRLDAEQIRDAILQISGRLDRTPGCPSDRQFDLKPG